MDLVLGKTGAGLQAYGDTTHVADLFAGRIPDFPEQCVGKDRL